MRTIHRHELPNIGGCNHIASYCQARILHAGAKGDIVCVWLEVDTKRAGQTLEFFVIQTGADMSCYPDDMSYIGTAITGDFVWHVYQRDITLLLKDEL